MLLGSLPAGHRNRVSTEAESAQPATRMPALGYVHRLLLTANCCCCRTEQALACKMLHPAGSVHRLAGRLPPETPQLLPTWLPAAEPCRLQRVALVLLLTRSSSCLSHALLHPVCIVQGCLLPRHGRETALGLVLRDDAAHCQKVAAAPVDAAATLLCWVVSIGLSLLLQGCPAVLDCIICAAPNLLSYEGPLVAMLPVALQQLRVLLQNSTLNCTSGERRVEMRWRLVGRGCWAPRVTPPKSGRCCSPLASRSPACAHQG